MRVAITGTHGVGKTTLALALSERLGVPMIAEVAREVIQKAGYKSTREYIEKAGLNKREEVQRKILEAQMTMEIMYSRDGFISDRSVFDAVAYTEAYGITGYPLHVMVGKAIAKALDTYDLLVYVPPMFDLVDDGFRDLSERLRWDVDLHIRKYIEAYEALKGKVLKIVSAEFDERIEEVMSALGLLEAKHGTV